MKLLEDTVLVLEVNTKTQHKTPKTNMNKSDKIYKREFSGPYLENNFTLEVIE